ncbi:MAG: T9SS type A sorting domain-containing protein [Deferribacteres bacterium]|nr:T9SS type A sorting domain-containing protein [candidate division KSB1 bacterium]MCB9503578.1 T9SS type A sorting domain-containing protein [Deferribacteres bacterium]
MKLIQLIIVLFLLFHSSLLAEVEKKTYAIEDKCGFDPDYAAKTFKILGHAWGYGYDTLLVDLQRWQECPYVEVDSIGASTQNRALWLVTITDTNYAISPRIRISIHARTHPGEVQSTWVTNEIIKILTGESELARLLRANCVFNIVPLYNPDGVELGYPRENANGVDLESNWFAAVPEQEVLVLRTLFEKNMDEENPIEVALNMHSAYACKRYFVFHDAAGTSVEYENMERDFVGAVYDQWPSGFEPWYYMVTWTSGTPYLYPESWFWLYHNAAVMALTYEDGNCDTAGEFDRTAAAILTGIAEYYGLQTEPSFITENPNFTEAARTVAVYPNPIGIDGIMHLFNPNDERFFAIQLFDIRGRRVHQFNQMEGSQTTFQLPSLVGGRYFLNFISEQKRSVVPITIIK